MPPVFSRRISGAADVGVPAERMEDGWMEERSAEWSGVWRIGWKPSRRIVLAALVQLTFQGEKRAGLKKLGSIQKNFRQFLSPSALSTPPSLVLLLSFSYYSMQQKNKTAKKQNNSEDFSLLNASQTMSSIQIFPLNIYKSFSKLAKICEVGDEVPV